MIDFLWEMGETKPLAGAQVTASRGGRNWSATSDDHGHYVLPVPGAGGYVLRAGLDPYLSSEEHVSVPRRGCAVQDVGMTVDNTISGRVLDRAGAPMENGRVGLIDLDRPPPDSDRHAWLDEAYVARGEQHFTFENVPLGRYLLMFNPDGPRWDRVIFDQAFDSSWYGPDGSRARATTIEVKSGGAHLTGIDIVAGAPATPRQVEVRVLYSDGQPVTTASVICTGAPLKPGEPDWVGGGYVKRDTTDGLVRFLAPSNRFLRIEVRDMYGRDMGRTYVSTYLPGTQPVMAEFHMQ